MDRKLYMVGMKAAGEKGQDGTGVICLCMCLVYRGWVNPAGVAGWGGDLTQKASRRPGHG